MNIPEEFLINRHGKQYILYGGLLNLAHQKGLKKITTMMIQTPNPINEYVAIVGAFVEMEEDKSFSGIGDASPQNVGKNIAPHIIRMAETRAKARALRDALNVFADVLEDDMPESTPGVVQDLPATKQETSTQRASTHQVDLLRTIAEDLRGPDGPERFEQRIGKPITELTRVEADDWIKRLTPAGEARRDLQ